MKTRILPVVAAVAIGFGIVVVGCRAPAPKPAAPVALHGPPLSDGQVALVNLTYGMDQEAVAELCLLARSFVLRTNQFTTTNSIGQLRQIHVTWALDPWYAVFDFGEFGDP
jgi:hypothetical protein